MACTVERLRQAARNVPVVLLLGRLKNSAWVGSIPPVLLALPRATSAECARARSVLSLRRCMQNGPADQADLADFIARGNKPDLVALLRHAGERLPSGCDTAADHRVVLLQYLKGSEDCGSMDHKRSQLPARAGPYYYCIGLLLVLAYGETL